MDKHLLDINITHPLQLSILDRLRHAQSATYSLIQPSELSGNEFGYHLKKLIAAKLVSKNGEHYSLTALGRLLSDVSSYETNKLKLRPVAGVWIKVTSGNKTLVYESHRAPMYDKTCLPFGKLRLGQTIQETVTRVLLKRGLNLGNVTILDQNHVNIQYKSQGEIIAHRYGVIVNCEYVGDHVSSETQNGRSYFSESNEYIEASAVISGKSDVVIEVG